MATKEPPLQVLLVDDNPGDVLLMQETFEELHVGVDVLTASDGAEALATLDRGVASGRLPDLVVLDLNMPGMNGMEVLQSVRANEDLRHLPVIIMTSTAAEEEVVEAYRSYASSLVTKPQRPGEMTEALRSLDAYWLRIAQLPKT